MKSSAASTPARVTWPDTAAGLSILLLVLGYTTSLHYLQIGWHIDAPIPVVWWAAGDAATALAVPMILVGYGWSIDRVAQESWRTVAARRVVPYLGLYVVCLLMGTAVLWRVNPGFPTARAHGWLELLEQLTVTPSDAWLIYAMALFALVAKLIRRVPPVVVLGASLVLAVAAASGAIAAPGNRAELYINFLFFVVGWRGRGVIERLAEMASSAAVVLLAVAVTAAIVAATFRGVAALPGMRPVVGIAAVFAGVTLAARAARRPMLARPLGAIGRATLPIYVLLLPLLAVLDALLLRRISDAPGPVRVALASTEPVALTAFIVAAGLTLHWILSWTRRELGGRSRPPRPASRSDLPTQPTPAAAELSTSPMLRVATLVALSLVLVPTACAPAAPAAPAAQAGSGNGTEVTVSFAGDVNFVRSTARLLDRPETAVGPATQLMAASDLAIVNLETPITDRGTPEPKRYLFRAATGAVAALGAGGVDAVSLANNHTLDYGHDGLADTVAAARAGNLGVFGAGANVDEAFAPWRTTIRGVRVAVFGFSQVDDLATTWSAKPDRAGIAMAFDIDRAVAAVTAARADSDLVIVVPHWGTEYDRCPNLVQREFAARMASAGADIVVGAHAHVLQGSGHMGNTFVAYGMGNFVWYTEGLLTPSSARTGILTLTVKARTVVRREFVPAMVSNTGQPVPMTGWPADLARRNYSALRPCAGLAA